MHAFNSLGDLNKFLVSKGLPTLTEEVIQEAIAKGLPTYERETDKDKLLSDYMDLTNEVIANLLIQKRAIAEELENEIKAHNQCHEAFEEKLHEIRIHGYAEGIAAGLVPGVPFEKIGPGIQEAIRRQAEEGIKQIDLIRSGR